MSRIVRRFIPLIGPAPDLRRPTFPIDPELEPRQKRVLEELIARGKHLV